MARRRISREDSLLMGRYCASVNLRRAARLVTRHYDEALAAAGVTATQLPLLAALNAGVGRSITTLADALDLERSTVSREIALLARRGLVASKTGGDKRTTALELTADGHQTLAAAFAAWRRAHEAIVSAYGEEAFEELLSRTYDLGKAVNGLPRPRRSR
jgi:DNA-binding MarR family transcriptional regulator